MGKSLLGRKIGQTAVVESPGGEITFEIVRVK
jgi:transcription elongation GreA/GreB family factor